MEMEVKEVSGECVGNEGREQVLWTLMKDFGYYLVNWFLDNFIGSYAYWGGQGGPWDAKLILVTLIIQKL